jgi:hypothetical protein
MLHKLPSYTVLHKISYENALVNSAPSQTFHIKDVRCTPANAPSAPACAVPTLIHVESQPLPLNSAPSTLVQTKVTTRPTHDHRLDANGIETYVGWDRCKVALFVGFYCFDANVVMKASNNNGASWSVLTCVNCATEDQFLPWVKTDRSRNIVNIAYYSSAADPTFQHRVRVILGHINPGGATPDPIEGHTITTLLNDPTASLEFSSGPGDSMKMRRAQLGWRHINYHTVSRIRTGRVPQGTCVKWRW